MHEMWTEQQVHEDVRKCRAEILGKEDGKWSKQHMGQDMVRKIDRQGQVLNWVQKMLGLCVCTTDSGCKLEQVGANER